MNTQEFAYALRHKKIAGVIPVVVDPESSNVGQWKGRLGLLGNKLVKTMFTDPEIFDGNDTAFDSKVASLYETIVSVCRM